MQSPLIDERAVAERLGVNVRTVQGWRFRKIGPAWVKLCSGAVRYRESDLEAFILAGLSTTEAA